MEPLAADDPRQVGEYRLLRQLGAGGMGRVYLGRTAGGRTVAVKVVRHDLAGDAEFRARFRHEVAAARRVGGTWTAPVLDADTEGGHPWVATGFVAGPALGDAVREFGPLPEPTVRTLGVGLAEALTHVHGLGLVHRDVKPSNVLLTLDGPRLIDFGIARALDSATVLTQSGQVFGSPGFMSPEQASGLPAGPPSDVFSLGTVLAFAATGIQPFGSGVSAPVLLYRVLHEEPDLSGLAGPLRVIVRDCLAKDPAARPTPGQLRERLDGDGEAAARLAHGNWLPASLAAAVGRSAVQLLDLEGEREAGAGEAARGGAAAPTAGPVATAAPATVPAPPTVAPAVPAAAASAVAPVAPVAPAAPAAPVSPASPASPAPDGPPVPPAAPAAAPRSGPAPATPPPAAPTTPPRATPVTTGPMATAPVASAPTTAPAAHASTGGWTVVEAARAARAAEAAKAAPGDGAAGSPGAPGAPGFGPPVPPGFGPPGSGPVGPYGPTQAQTLAPVPGHVPHPQRPRGRRGYGALAGVLVVVLLLGGGYLLTERLRDDDRQAGASATTSKPAKTVPTGGRTGPGAPDSKSPEPTDDASDPADDSPAPHPSPTDPGPGIIPAKFLGTWTGERQAANGDVTTVTLTIAQSAPSQQKSRIRTETPKAGTWCEGAWTLTDADESLVTYASKVTGSSPGERCGTPDGVSYPQVMMLPDGSLRYSMDLTQPERFVVLRKKD
ncbi:serine/threonine-protein kinase [Kitasatospora sp. NPDC047058]|uniref:serine/threonine-protein kinase n=1 Tax=Kitasatospora sp. NPDC047058 TaxID=3155620 RepID=UPI0033FBA9E0